MSDKQVYSNNLRDYIQKIRKSSSGISEYTEEEILSIIDEHASDLILSEDEQISIMTGNNKESKDYSQLRDWELKQEVRNAIIAKACVNGYNLNCVKNEQRFTAKLWQNIKSWAAGKTFEKEETHEINHIEEKVLDDLNFGNAISTSMLFVTETGQEATRENMIKFLKGEFESENEKLIREYKQKQDNFTDFTGDLVSGISCGALYTLAAGAIVAFGAPAALLGGAVLGAGLIGGGIKVGWRALNDKEYNTAGKDFLTGFVNGILTPIGGGAAATAAKTLVTKVGGIALKEGLEAASTSAVSTVVKGFGSTVKEALINPFGYKYVGSAKAILVGYGTEFALDGALGGAADATARALYDGEDVADAVKQGFISGAAGGILLGGAMKGLGSAFHRIGDNLGREVDVTDIQTTKVKSINKSVKQKAEKLQKELDIVSEEDIAIFKYTTSERVVRQDEIDFENSYFAMLEEKLANNKNYQESLKVRIDETTEYLQKHNKPISQKRIEQIKREEIEWSVSTEDIKLTEAERESFLDFLRKNTGITDERLELIQQNDKKILKRVLDQIEQKRTNGNVKFDLARILENKGVLENYSELDLFTYAQLYNLSEMASELHFTEVEKSIVKDFDWSKIAKSNVLEIIKEKAPNDRLLQSYILKEFLLSPENFAVNAAKVMKKYNYFKKQIDDMPKLTRNVCWSFSALNINDFMSGKRTIEDLLSVDHKLLLIRGSKELRAESFDKLLAIDDKYLKRVFGDEKNPPLCKLSYTNETDYIIEALALDPKLTIKVLKMNDNRELPRFKPDEVIEIVNALKADPINTNRLLKSVGESKAVANQGGHSYDVPNYRYSADMITKIIENNSDPNKKFDYIEILESRCHNNKHRIRDNCMNDVITAFEKYPDEAIRLFNLKNSKGDYYFLDYDYSETQFLKTAECLHKYPEVMNKFLGLMDNSGKSFYDSSYIARFADLYTSHPEKMNKLLDLGFLSDNIIYKLYDQNIDYALNLAENYKRLEIPKDKLCMLLEYYGKFSVREYKKAIKIMGKENAAKLTDSDMSVAISLIGLYGKKSINEIKLSEKKEILQVLVAQNVGMFSINDDMKKMFPLIPTNQKEYCSLLPALVRSLGIETNTLDATQVVKFNESLRNLSNVLSKISDENFASLHIRQEYSKDDFIQNVLKIVKDLSSSERQKVYDYFGFELHHNSGNSTGYSITGYPVNLNNGKKLAEITNPKTKEIVELLRTEVIKFSHNNPIKCENLQLEKFLNDVAETLPELRAQIGKVQHGSHDYDVLQHSLKVLQKISQDPKFTDLNESDKKIMMLVSLLHDITKREGKRDITHSTESAFDAFYIAKKFKLTREEEIKLYTLAKHHEWLEYVNTSKSEEQLTKRLQSVAYDLQNDNLFDLALMFTHADLRAVKTSDAFHDTIDGKSRVLFDGKTRRSFGESAESYAQRIRNYVLELKKTQPLLPVTQIPNSSRIAQAIKTVNSDGSTNIKGVYKDTDGLIVIKYNEVEDWEAIGFPEGSISRGIKASSGSKYGGEEFIEDIDTGNIHFFVHALDFENQLAKFDAFSLPDSDALLSISYAERPESKFRFFREQGVLLDFETKYVHGGGDHDAGSGYGKNIAEFKKNYIFGGRREEERKYISKIIKTELGMNDDEYLHFIKENENKPFTDIYPIETREKLIKTLASINSNERKGKRSYNEMYGSNPRRVMGVFAYGVDYTKSVGNPIQFLKKKVIEKYDGSFGNSVARPVAMRTRFLRKYALEHDIPFFIFGD